MIEEVDGVSVRREEPLARHVAWRTGGTCDAFVTIHRAEAIPDALAAIRREGWTVHPLGCGTRTVVRDGGLSGAVVRFGTGLSTAVVEGDVIRAGAGIPVAALVALAAAAGRGGLADLAVWPGSLGAALRLGPEPAGGWAGRVDEVSWIARGRVRTGTLDEARRQKRPWFVSATLRLPADDGIAAAVDAAWARSRGGPGWFAPLGRGSLEAQITRAGLAGVRVREVAIPRSAPGMLVNLGGATGRDLALMERTVVDRVRRERGIVLEPAVVWAGSHGR